MPAIVAFVPEEETGKAIGEVETGDAIGEGFHHGIRREIHAVCFGAAHVRIEGDGAAMRRGDCLILLRQSPDQKGSGNLKYRPHTSTSQRGDCPRVAWKSIEPRSDHLDRLVTDQLLQLLLESCHILHTCGNEAMPTGALRKS